MAVRDQETLLFFRLAAAGALLLGGCRTVRGPAAILQECVEIPGRVVVVPGIHLDGRVETLNRSSPAPIDPLTGKPSGIGAVVVTVFTAFGRPLEGAQVIIPDTDRGQTDKNGRVEFRWLAPREHRITVSASNLLAQELALVSRAGYLDTIRVYLTTPSDGMPCDQRR